MTACYCRCEYDIWEKATTAMQNFNLGRGVAVVRCFCSVSAGSLCALQPAMRMPVCVCTWLL